MGRVRDWLLADLRGEHARRRRPRPRRFEDRIPTWGLIVAIAVGMLDFGSDVVVDRTGTLYALVRLVGLALAVMAFTLLAGRRGWWGRRPRPRFRAREPEARAADDHSRWT